MVRNFEDDYLSTHLLTPELALSRMSDMYEFCRKYGKAPKTMPHLSQHVKTVITLSGKFRQIYNKQQEK